MADVFISYKSERKPAAAHLAEVLDAYGFEVWYDHELLPGHEYEPRLIAELQKASAILVLWCTKAVSSKWVQKEAALARDRNVYLPCWIEPAVLPKSFDRDHILSLINWDASPGSGDVIAVAEALGKIINKQPVSVLSKISKIDAQWRRYGRRPFSKFEAGPPIDARSEEPQTLPRIKINPGKGSSSRLVHKARWLKLLGEYGLKGNHTNVVRVKAAAELLRPSIDRYAGTEKFDKVFDIMEDFMERIERSDDSSIIQVLGLFQDEWPDLLREIENDPSEA